MKNCKLSQEFSVVIFTSVLSFNLFQEIPVVFSCLLRKRLQVCLDSIVDLAPFTAEHGVRLLIWFLALPVFVVVCTEFLFQIYEIFLA